MNHGTNPESGPKRTGLGRRPSRRIIKRLYCLLLRSFQDFRRYRQLRRLHKDTLRRSFSGYLKKGKDFPLDEIEKQAFMKAVYSRRLVTWYVVLPVIVLLAGLSLYSIQPMNSTRISADIALSSFSFETGKAYVFERNDIDRSNSSEIIMLNGQVRDQGDYVNTSGDVLLKADKGDTLELTELVIPDTSNVTIYKLRPSDLQVIVQQKGNTEISGKIDVFNGHLITDTTIAYQYQASGTNQRPNSIQFHKNFADNVNFELSIIKSKWFELPKIYANRIISFNKKNALNEKSSSAVISGSIYLLDTNNDSIKLKAGDSLKIGFKEAPVKLSIRSDQNAIHLLFDAEVNVLLAGPEILGETNKLNQMPLRIQTLYYKAPYIWAIIIAILPIIIPYLWRRREDTT